jgi:hypothetical protein
MSGPYVNDDGDIWIERGSARWPAIQREAREAADEMGDYANDDMRIVYAGLVSGVRVTDEHEEPCSIMDPDDPLCTCCRTITAHHFRTVER